MARMSADVALALVGAPEKVAAELSAFSQTARLLSSQHPRLIDEHPQQWVGLYDGRVQVFGKTLKSVMSQIAKKGFPKEEVIVRFIDKEEKTLIL